MAKDIDLLSYWMPVLRKIKEFREIANTEEPELRYLLEACDKTLDNLFILTADNTGLARYEAIMGIYPEDGADLESRRFNILVKWNDKVPYTDEELYNRLLSLCGGADKFRIDPHYEEYRLDIETTLGIKGAFEAVGNLLQEMIPCNIVLDLQNVIREAKTSPLYYAVALTAAMSYQITNDINKQYTATAPHNIGVGVGNAGTHIITHDMDSKVATEIPLNEAVAVSNAFSEIITHDVGLNDSLEAYLTNAIGVGVAHTTLVTHDIQSNANVTGNSTVADAMATATVITIKS